MQPQDSNKTYYSQTEHWSDSELRRIANLYELLIRVDKRVKKSKYIPKISEVYEKERIDKK